MQAQVKKWGNSLALRIPKVLANEIEITTDGFVDITIVDGQLVIKPLQENELTLDSLLAEITPENVHQEIDTGTAVGNEVW